MGCWGKIAEALAEIFVSSLATDKVAEDWMGPMLECYLRRAARAGQGLLVSMPDIGGGQFIEGDYLGTRFISIWIDKN